MFVYVDDPIIVTCLLLYTYAEVGQNMDYIWYIYILMQIRIVSIYVLETTQNARSG